MQFVLMIVCLIGLASPAAARKGHSMLSGANVLKGADLGDRRVSQPKTLETGLEMSETVRENFDSLIDAIIKKLREWGIEVTEKKIPSPPLAGE